jgi:hypothetical protein
VTTADVYRNKNSTIALFEGTQGMICAPLLLLAMAMIATAMNGAMMKAATFSES